MNFQERVAHAQRTSFGAVAQNPPLHEYPTMKLNSPWTCELCERLMPATARLIEVPVPFDSAIIAWYCMACANAVAAAWECVQAGMPPHTYEDPEIAARLKELYGASPDTDI